MPHKKWVIRDADKEKASEISEKLNIDPFVAFLLVSRGISNEAQAAAFLSDSCVIPSPFDFADMEEASFVIGDAVDNGLKICIYGDYDCDGVTATALLYSYLKNEGADVCYYIPDRETEGYGLNIQAIDKIRDEGVNLIVTVDNGISAVKEARYIYESGMSLVITDHHQIPETLPQAQAVVNPHRKENNLSFRDYCGAGVALMLVCAMYDGDYFDVFSQYCDLAAVGTIGDVVALIDANRSIVRSGIDKINNNPRPSVKAFLEANSKNALSSTDIAFQLCPRLNAMGRMGDASRAVEFLICEDEELCREKCSVLNLENAQRQETEKNILSDIEEKISKNPSLVRDRVIVIEGDNYHCGVIGIVASHIVEKYGKPAFVLSVSQDGTARGSARSVEGFDIYEALCCCGDVLTQFGGHPLAAGITLESSKTDEFRQRINDFAKEHYPTMPPVKLLIDYKISPFYLTAELAESLEVLEPYGAGNSRAVFGVYNMSLLSVTSMSGGKHIRMELEKKGRKIRVVWFGMPIDDFPYRSGDVLNLALRISRNFYREKYYLSLQAEDVRLASTDDDKYFSQLNDYNMFQLGSPAKADMYPNRNACKAVYKQLAANNGRKLSCDDLYFRIQSSVTYSQMMFALKAFSQSGLVSFKNNVIKINKTDVKVNLDETHILKTVKERLKNG